MTLSNKWLLSATEIDTFNTCRRKWAYQYLDDIKPPPAKAAKFGLLVHEFLQKYLTGYSIDHHSPEGLVAGAGLQYLPRHLPITNVERSILFLNNGHIFHGYIDFYEEVGSQTWLIGDHKTCSTFATALTPDELKANIQANIYAQWAFQELGAETVKLKWIYYRTKGTPQAKCIEAEIKKPEQNSLFWPQLQIASDIKTIVEKKLDSVELPKNLSACFKYGRCPFYGPCRANQKPTAAEFNNPTEVRRLPVSKNYSSEAEVMFPKGKESFHLFIDCIPTKTGGEYKQTIELSDLLKPVLTKIQQEKELSHYRLAGYGQHVGLIANYLTAFLKDNTYDSQTAILSSLKTPEGCDTLQTLTAAAGKVVRGF